MRRRFAVALVVAGFLFGIPAAAGAHANLSTSDPADGALLQQAPSGVTMDFTEPPDPGLSVVHVLDSHGAAVESGPATSVAGKPMELSVPLGALPDGAYTVSWRTVSKADGHVTTGAFAFGVGVDSVAPSPGASGGSAPPPSVASVVGRWFLYVGLSLLIGACVVRRWIFKEERNVVGLWIGLLLAVVGLGLEILTEASTVGVSVGRLLGSAAGDGLVRQIVGLILCTAAVATYQATRRGGALTLLAIAVLLTMFAHAAAGHAGASGGALAIPVWVQWVHIAAAGIWVGGLVWLLIYTRGRDAQPAQAKGFSRIATYAILVVAATGILRAVDELGGWSGLTHALSSSFGVTLTIKVAMFLGLAVLGFVNRSRNVPRVVEGKPATAALRRTVLAEVVLAAGIFGFTGVLSQLPPPALATQAPPAGVTAKGTDFAHTEQVELSVTPGYAGPNTYRVVVTNPDSGDAVPADRVALRFDLPAQPDLGETSLDLRKASDGHWEGSGTQLSIEGSWQVTALVQTGTDSVEIPLQVKTRARPQQVSVSTIAGQPTVYTFTVPTGTLQTYIDPGSTGTNELHVTAFDPSGKELPLDSANVEMLMGTGHEMPEPVRRFGPGHFVADLNLDPGTWTFQVQATTKDGTVVDARFQQTIQGEPSP